ncbi:MAG: DUF1580 domain-containing protein [Pirellulaceae bacterium]
MIESENLITFSEASRLVPPHGAHVSTVWRWALNGLADGRKLETIKIGGRIYTSREALGRFLTAPQSQSPRPTSAGQRERKIDAAQSELAAFGV